VSHDRVTFNEPGDWSGPDYALGLVDEIVLSNAVVHFEMLDDGCAYMIVRNGEREVLARFVARRTTRRERWQILAHSQDRLRDHARSLLPARWSRTWWSVPAWRRPAAVVREALVARRYAGAVLCVRVEEDTRPESAAEPSEGDAPPVTPEGDRSAADGDVGPQDGAS
jgi:hypothetical protein